MDNFSAQNEFYITPEGNPKDSTGLFSRGTGYGLLTLAGMPYEKSDSKIHLQAFIKDFIQRMFEAYIDNPQNSIKDIFLCSEPTIDEYNDFYDNFPNVKGIEYLNILQIKEWIDDFKRVFANEFSNFKGKLPDFIRNLSEFWKNLDKVTFHLAENKGSNAECFPFAFMVSFEYATGKSGLVKKYPLATAMKVYFNDKNSLDAVLKPITNVAEKSQLINILLNSKRIFKPTAFTAREAYQFIKDIPIFEEEKIGVRLTNNSLRSKSSKAKVSIKIGEKEKSLFGADSLCDFSVNLTIDGEKVSRDELNKLLSNKDGLVRFHGKWVEINSENINSVLQKWENRFLSPEYRNGISFLDSLKLIAGLELGNKGSIIKSEEANDVEIEAGKGLKDYLSNLTTSSNDCYELIPENLSKILRPYQKDGVVYLSKMSENSLGTCLADDMGLGKTLQVLTLISIWKKQEKLKNLPVLVVLPLTLLENWKVESNKFTPNLKIAVLHDSAMNTKEKTRFIESPADYLKGFDIALVTYNRISRLSNLADLKFPAVIADEAQAIKNPSSNQSKAVRKLKATNKIALTGTPIENSLTDLWSIFDFINHGMLGSLKSFAEYTKSIKEDYKPLRKLTKPFILRRLKTDKTIINDLPDKTEIKVYCTLSKEQAILYKRCVNELENAIESYDGDNFGRSGLVLAYLTKFKQICNHPAQFLGTGDYETEKSGKFSKLQEIAEIANAKQEKMLVFTQYREITKELQFLLAELFGRTGFVLHGGTSVKERSRMVKEFQDPDGPPFFVLSLKAGGSGLNLTAASHVVHFDRWWNPAVENQASDRSYRIGQKKNVLIHKFICKGTLEDKIDLLLTQKQELFDEILSKGTEKLLTEMSNKELLELVKFDSSSIE